MSCILCERLSPSSFYNFHVTATTHSKIPVENFCQKIFGTPLQLMNDMDELICEYCYNSINELDYMEQRTKVITEDLKRRYQTKQNKIIISSLDSSEVYSVISLNNDAVEDESDDNGALDFRSKTPPIQEQNSSNRDNVSCRKIHFSNDNELKNILNFKEESANSDEEKLAIEEHDVNVLYDMMDEKNIAILVEQKRENDSPRKPHKCRKCSSIFETNQELKSHLASHSEEQPFICEVCGKIYRHKTALDIHVGMHKGINPFKCLYCNKSFTQKGALIRHVKIHTGEKPFQCEQCGKCFTHHTSFNIHKISHSGEKSYKCEICGLKLISTSHLKRHMRVHTGEKKYHCNTCGKRFAERYNLVSHQKLHSIGAISSQRKRFKCDICGSTYRRRAHLDEHLMKEHAPDDKNFIYLSANE